MAGRRNSSKYSSQQSSTIRYNIMAALDELATFNGIDIKTMQTTTPYSMELNGITSQKIAAELKKMIDLGTVVKSTKTRNGKTVKYMLNDRYRELLAEGKLDKGEFGYMDHRDKLPEVTQPSDEELIQQTCERIAATADRAIYEPEW